MLTKEQLIAIGKQCRDSKDGNYLVGSFAAELVGEAYPFSKTMCEIVFRSYNDEQLGQKFVEWFRKGDVRYG